MILDIYTIFLLWILVGLLTILLIVLHGKWMEHSAIDFSDIGDVLKFFAVCIGLWPAVWICFAYHIFDEFIKPILFEDIRDVPMCLKKLTENLRKGTREFSIKELQRNEIEELKEENTRLRFYMDQYFVSSTI